LPKVYKKTGSFFLFFPTWPEQALPAGQLPLPAGGNIKAAI